mmetsp:Transcript_13453/g.24829  ORF Transcript_13453/g.24829 Transcript_13453/m.24829 type:complete len:123 (+) Transcript_13453:183-551(+)
MTRQIYIWPGPDDLSISVKLVKTHIVYLMIVIKMEDRFCLKIKRLSQCAKDTCTTDLSSPPRGKRLPWKHRPCELYRIVNVNISDFHLEVFTDPVQQFQQRRRVLQTFHLANICRSESFQEI